MRKNYLALGGLFACLHVLFLLLTKIVVGSEMLLILFLPLLSTIYTLKCDKKSTFMFVIATFLICFVFDFISTFIYVIPSLICGIVYGELRKKGFRELELLCLSGFVHMLSIAFSFLVIVLLFREVEFLGIFERIFSVSGEKLFVISLLSLLVLGFCEAFIVHVITDSELDKLFVKVEKNDTVPKWFVIPASVSLIVHIGVAIFSEIYSIFPLISFFVFFIPYIIDGIINFKYKGLTFGLISFFALISLLIMPHINFVSYLLLPVFIFSPFVINNFQDYRKKALK